MVRGLIATVAALGAAAALGAPAAWAEEAGVRLSVDGGFTRVLGVPDIDAQSDVPGGISPHHLLEVLGVAPAQVTTMAVRVPSGTGVQPIDASIYGAPPQGADPPRFDHAYHGDRQVEYVEPPRQPLQASDDQALVVEVRTSGGQLHPVLDVAPTGSVAAGEAVTFGLTPGTPRPAHLVLDFGDGSQQELDTTGAPSPITHAYAVAGSYPVVLTSFADGAGGVDTRTVQVGAPTTASAPTPAAPVPGAAPGGTGAGGGAGAATGPTAGPQRSPSRRPGPVAGTTTPTRTSTAPARTSAATATTTATAPATTTRSAPPATTPTTTRATPPPTTTATTTPTAPTRRRDPQPQRRSPRPAAPATPASRVSGIVLAGAGASPGDLLAASALVPQAVRAAARPGDRARGSTSVPTWAVVVGCALGLLAVGGAAEGRRSRRDLLDVGR